MELANKLFKSTPQKQFIELHAVLEKSLSTDELEAETAQVILLQICQSSVVEYLVKMSNILHEINYSSNTRRGAAIQLRNAFIAREGDVQQMEYDQKWFSIHDDIRQHIKRNIIKSLGTEEVRPSAAASAIASIANTEFPHNQWPDLLSILMENITNTGNLEQKKEASLDTIDLLCQELTVDSRQILRRNSNKVLKSILTGMKAVNNRTVLAATRALSHATELFQENFEIESQRNFIMQVVCETAQTPDIEIKVAALTCVLCVVTRYYEYMDHFMDTKLFPIAIEAMKSDVKEVRVKGIEFCRELCYLEEDLKKSGYVGPQICNVKALSTTPDRDRKKTPRYDRSYIKKALESLLPIFMEMLTNHVVYVKSNEVTPEKVNEREDETWDILTYFLETLISTFADNSVRQYISVFVAKNIKNTDWRFRNAAVTALSLLLKGEKENVKNLLPRLMDIILYDKNYEVRASTAHTIAEACAALQENDDNLKMLVQALLYELNDGPKVAIGICDAFSRLAFAGRGNITENFEIIVPRLLKTICRADGDNRLRWDASIAVGYVVGQSPMKCYFTVHKSMLIIIGCLRDPTNPFHSTESLSTLCVTVQTILKRLSQDEASQIANMIMCCLLETFSKMEMALDKSVLRMISTLVKVLQDKFIKYVGTFQPTLVLTLERKPESTFAGVALLADICHAVGFHIYPYCHEVLPLLLEILQNNGVNRFLKEQVISTIGMIARSIGPDFKDYLDKTITTLVCLQSHVDRFRINNSDFIRNQTEIHKFLLKAYLGIIQGFKNDERVIIRVQRMLKPCINSIVEVITRIVHVHNGYLERFVPVCIEELNDLCSVYGSSILDLVDNPHVLQIVDIGLKSEKAEVKKLAGLVIRKIEKLRLPIEPAPSPTTKLYKRGIELLLKQPFIKKLFFLK